MPNSTPYHTALSPSTICPTRYPLHSPLYVSMTKECHSLTLPDLLRKGLSRLSKLIWATWWCLAAFLSWDLAPSNSRPDSWVSLTTWGSFEIWTSGWARAEVKEIERRVRNGRVNFILEELFKEWEWSSRFWRRIVEKEDVWFGGLEDLLLSK